MTQTPLGFVMSGPPRGARGRYPYAGHRTMAEVLENERENQRKMECARSYRWTK